MGSARHTRMKRQGMSDDLIERTTAHHQKELEKRQAEYLRINGPENRALLQLKEKARRLREDAYALREDTEAARFQGTLHEEEHGMKIIKRLQIVDDSYFVSEQYIAQQQRADWRFVDARIKAFSGMYMKLLRRRKIPVFVHCAFRTPAEQADRFTEGASRLVGPMASHVQGMAVDIVHSKFPWRCTKNEYAYFNKIAQEAAAMVGVDMEYGYNWGWDSCHFELRNWRDLVKNPADVFRAMDEQPEPVRITSTALYKQFTRGYTQPTRKKIIERRSQDSQLTALARQWDRNR